MKKFCLALGLLLLATASFAIDASKPFDDPDLQARYEKIISEVRCLQCQNESLENSNAFLAVDLRREIRRLLSEGKTNSEVYDYLEARYGDFALYRPRMSGNTLFLWIAPLALLAVGGAVFILVLRRRMALPLDDDGNGAPGP